jgi:uncharacterized membrane protein YeaQ/YmgE (transglycosylase-associated protein family)
MLWMILLGAAAGWLAGQLMRGQGFGLVGNILVGIVGSVVGGMAFRLIQVQATGPFGELLTATVGAVLLVYLVDKLRR